MAKGVFLHRIDSIYDDEPEERYQFPKKYLKAAQHCIGDWIIYLEPVKAGRMAITRLLKFATLLQTR